MTSLPKLGYIGIGAMGYGIVLNLLKSGYPVTFAPSRNRERAESLKNKGAREASDLQSLASECEILFLTVPDSTAVESVLLSKTGITPHLRKGQMVVDMSTSHPSSTRNIHAHLEEREIDFLDAPLTGSRPQAEAGTLTVLCGGAQDSFTRLQPIFAAFSNKAVYVGPVGSGHTLKLINNFLGLVNAAAVSEIIPFAEKSEIPLETLYEAVSISGGDSKAFQNLMPKILKNQFDLNFRLELGRKDLFYLNHIAGSEGVPCPIASTALSVFTMAVAAGLGGRDYTELYRFWKEISGPSQP